MDRRKGLLIAAAVIAVLGTLLVVAYVRSANTRAADQYHAVKVLRVVKPISQGESVADAQSAGAFSLSDVPQTALLTGALTDLSSINGDVALTNLYPGEQVVSAKFGSSQSSTGVTIPNGMIAISVSLTDPSRVASFVNPGNAVAVFENGTSGPNGGYSRLLLPKVLVIAVGSTSTQPDQSTNKAQGSSALPSTLLTFAVTQQQAEKIFFGQTQGTLSLALLNSQSKVAPSGGVNNANLFH
ncbi:MAG: Flp pilus assembly protein CpaB [Marmoricola sp.]